MFPAANVSTVAVKPVQPAPALTAQKTSQPQAPETARTSSGESAAANIKAETSIAVQATEQSAVAPRLRDQETAERTERSQPVKDQHAGPPPTFEESPLERQARVAFDPPEAEAAPLPKPVIDDAGHSSESTPAPDEAPAPEETHFDPPPTRTEKAEASFSETRSLADQKEPATVDLAR